MKQSEIEQKLIELESQVKTLNTESKIAEIETLKEQASTLVQSIRDEKTAAEGIMSELSTIATEVAPHKAIIEAATTTSTEYQTHINSQKEEYEASKTELNEHKKQYTGLVDTTKLVLGVANAEVLASSFKGQADQHKESVHGWFKWIVGATAALILASTSVVAWEFLTSNMFLSTNFLIKTTLTAPFVFFLAFSVKHYGREKRLHEEYSFKSAVALSLEAYRRLISDPVDPTSDHQRKVLDFVITSVSGIYMSPIESMHKYKESEAVASEVVDHLKSIVPSLDIPTIIKERE